MTRPSHHFESGVARVRVRVGGFALSVGETPPIVVDRKGAQDILHALTYALLATVPPDPPRRRRRLYSPRPAKLRTPEG